MIITHPHCFIQYGIIKHNEDVLRGITTLLRTSTPIWHISSAMAQGSETKRKIVFMLKEAILYILEGTIPMSLLIRVKGQENEPYASMHNVISIFYLLSADTDYSVITLEMGACYAMFYYTLM